MSTGFWAGAARRLGKTLFLLGWVFSPLTAQAFQGGPKTFLFYGRNHFDPGDTEIIARYDAVGLDVDAPASVVNEIKSFNPNIKVLAYIPINGTWDAAPDFPAGSKWREMYDAAEANDWWLYNTQGGRVHDHPEKSTFNLTDYCPTSPQGQRMVDWYPEFIVNSVLQNGASPWDGVFLDDVWVGIWFINNNTVLNPFPIDADRDGEMDDQQSLDLMWRAANDTITARIRREMPAGEILIGNGDNPFYHMNGTMLETFPFKGIPESGHPLGYTWNSKMFGLYGYFQNEDGYSDDPLKMNVINTKWPDGDRLNPVRTPEYERRKRFCLASTMLRDGYFSIDLAPLTGGGHFSLWWEPEFEKQIGTPIGSPYQATYAGMTLWRRDYTNGSVILNQNWTPFMGSTADGLPPMGFCDARILLTGEFWQPETTPPAAVTDLTVTRTWTNQIEIQWTNAGDDGTSGQAVQVEARYSTSPITAANWASAPAAPGTVIPGLPGSTQLLIVPGLTNNTLYYFAVKTRDLAGNWSAISNVISATTVTGDITAPSPVTDLAVLSTTSTTAVVQWTATGDDGTSGNATSFDLRYATFPLDATSFNSASAVVGEPVPGPPGAVHSMQLYGMLAGTTYYFAVRVGDEMPNWSPLSNIVVAATQPGDVTPPAAIADLRPTGVGIDWITLSWTAPGDDGLNGRATQYDMRYSTSPITAANFNSAGYVTNEPGPATAGTTQSVTVQFGIGPRTYYFALKTRDEVNNWSAMSNVAMATTNSGDTTPPSAITNLAVTGTDFSSVSLSWTAPGDNGSSGTASSYDLRYSTSPITSGNFSAATPAAGEPLPAAAGTPQSMTVGSLNSGTLYYFAVLTADEVPNWSAISNVPSGTTQSVLPPDTTPPAAVTDLSATPASSSSMSLSWTSPGDDGASGTAATYDLRYSTSAITAASFGTATAVTGEPAPAAAGIIQSMSVGGLSAGVTYYFAIKTADEVPNWSAISNVPSGTPPVPPDTTPPAAITNLAVTGTTSSSASLSWTAPGDDGATGTASGYDIRYSTSAITSANFGSAVPVLPPTVAAPGTVQTKTISGLAAGTTYYFAVKTADEVPNWSALSNVPSAATQPPPAPDTTPPAAVTNLAVTGTSTSSVSLSWTAPGDDGSTGTAAGYDLRYSTSAITDLNFSSATAVTGEPVPAAAGTPQSMTVSSLAEGTTYYFALKTLDEAPNTSALSNVVSGTTQTTPPPPPPPDTTPPAAVTNLAVTGTTSNSVTLTWTSPGDDGGTGTATLYDIRRRTSTITSGNFNSSTAVIGEPAPAAAGTVQTMTISGLSANTTYYFALKASDEVPNWSVISNVVSATTPATPPPGDTTPPSAVTSLTVSGATSSSLNVSWTAPGDDGLAGTASVFDLRYSTSLITSASFASAAAVSGEPPPGPSGTGHTMTVNGLSAGTTYYFAIKTADEVPNWSGLSNVPSGTTLPPPDVTPPSAVTNLAVIGMSSTSVTVGWTAPGDDAATGTAAVYDLRYAVSPITAAGFASATPADGEPPPTAAGTSQAMTVTGLSPGVAYYFALKTADEVPNWSGLSNVVSAAPPPPAAAPPLAPALVTAERIGNLVRIAWAPNAESDLAGYMVYRRPLNGQWTPRTEAPVSATEHNDTLSSRYTTLEYCVTAVNTSEMESPHSEIMTIIVDDLLPPPLVTEQNEPSPNPFRTATSFVHVIPGGGVEHVRAQVRNVQGRVVRTLHNGEASGALSITWDGRSDRGENLPAGIYFITVRSGDRVAVRKVIRAR